MVRIDWFLAKNQSGCCRFDPCFPKARVCFYKGLNLKNRCLALLFVKYKDIFSKCLMMHKCSSKWRGTMLYIFVQFKARLANIRLSFAY